MKAYLCQVGKRNIRIRRQELQARLGELEKQEAHVVLLDGRTFFGIVVATEQQSLTIQDVNAPWTNIKRHTHRLPLTDIMEVIFDKVTDY